MLVRFVVPIVFVAAACGPSRTFDFNDASDIGDVSDSVSIDAAHDAAPDASDIAQAPDVPRDTVLQPDGACASASAAATVEVLPVDIIWVVDNSVSMEPAITQITTGLNDFASLIDSSGLDYRVVMLSLRSPTPVVMVSGGTRYAVCIPPPLAGDSMCGNGPRFFQSSVDILSTQPLDQFLGTLGQTAGYLPGETRGGEPWRPFLRTNSTKTIVVVSDDNSRLSMLDFLNFAGGPNPANASLTLPPGILDPSWSGLFDNYTFDAIYGWGSDTDPSIRCTYSDGSLPSSSGPVYTSLVAGSGGVRAQICAGAIAWGPFFASVASAVAHTSRIACNVAIPPPPDGTVFDPTLINVVFDDGTTRTYVGNVTDATACGTTGGWYYDDPIHPTAVLLCPASCDAAQMQLRGPGAALDVEFGCETIPG